MAKNNTGMMARVVGMLSAMSLGGVSTPRLPVMRSLKQPISIRRNRYKNKGRSHLCRGMNSFHGYRHRGNNAGHYNGPHQGEAECARRLRQREKGMIP